MQLANALGSMGKWQQGDWPQEIESMNATHLSSAPPAWKQRCAWVASILAATIAPFGDGVLAEEPITAVYKAQELAFHYRSTNQFYACHELQQRVRAILLAIGARDDIEVDARNCDMLTIQDDFPDAEFERDSTNTWDRWNSSSRLRRSGRDREQAAHVRIRLMMPVEVTPQVLEEIDKDRSRRELVSRVTGNPAAAMNDPVVFAATRQAVTLSHQTIRLQPEDCELVEQMNQQVFRKLDVRVTRNSSSCNPRVRSRIPPQLTVEALLPTGALLPMPDPEKKKAEPPTQTPPQ